MKKKRVTIPILFLFLSTMFLLPLSAQNLDLTERLAGLCRVWGFLKYYHNNVGQGKIGWNLILVNFIPRVEAAESMEEFNHEIVMLIRAAGEQPNGPTAGSRFDAHDAPFSWIHDPRLFLPHVVSLLEGIGLSFQPGYNYYVYADPTGGQPMFTNDASYMEIEDPSLEYRLLALFRYWNIVHYFFPYQDVMDEDWDEVLLEYIPKMRAATQMGYQLLFLELAAHLNDGHAFTYGSLTNSFWGYNYVPLKAKWIEKKTVVTYASPRLLAGANVRVGDVITHINGTDVDTLRQEKRKYVWGSNEMGVQYNLCDFLLRSKAATLKLTLDRGGEILDVEVPTCAQNTAYEEWLALAVPSLTYSLLPGNIGYAIPGLFKTGDAEASWALLRDARAIVFDLRWGMKSEGFTLMADHFFYIARSIACWKMADLSLPGTFYYTPEEMWGPAAGNPDCFQGMVVALVSEDTMSAGETGALVIQAVPGARIIGSLTAGANGNITYVNLPGYVTTSFSGLGVFYPDLRPTQRLGIARDIDASPTIAGIRAGRDEILERALEYIETGR